MLKSETISFLNWKVIRENKSGRRGETYAGKRSLLLLELKGLSKNKSTYNVVDIITLHGRA